MAFLREVVAAQPPRRCEDRKRLALFQIQHLFQAKPSSRRIACYDTGLFELEPKAPEAEVWVARDRLLGLIRLRDRLCAATPAVIAKLKREGKFRRPDFG